MVFVVRFKSFRFGYKILKNWKFKYGYCFSMVEKRVSEYFLFLLIDIIFLRICIFVILVENIFLWYKIFDYGWILIVGIKYFLDWLCILFVENYDWLCVWKNIMIYGEKIILLIISLYLFCVLCYCNLFLKVFNEDYIDEYWIFYCIFWYKRFFF